MSTVIDWSSPSAKITPNFTVRDACWLQGWQVLHKPNARERENLIKTCELLEQVLTLLKVPRSSLRIHCMIRPKVVNAPGTKWHKQDYNAHVGGAPGSPHPDGLAVDFDVIGSNCDDVRKFLLPHLETLDCRIEDYPGADWIHADKRPPPPRGKRYFKP